MIQGLIGRTAQPERGRGQKVLDPSATGAFGGPWVPDRGARVWELQLCHTFPSSGHEGSGAAPQTSTPLLHCRENSASSLYWSSGPPLLESTHLFPLLL